MNLVRHPVIMSIRVIRQTSTITSLSAIYRYSFPDSQSFSLCSTLAISATLSFRNSSSVLSGGNNQYTIDACRKDIQVFLLPSGQSVQHPRIQDTGSSVAVRGIRQQEHPLREMAAGFHLFLKPFNSRINLFPDLLRLIPCCVFIPSNRNCVFPYSVS